ncbi:MAG: nitrogenase component 1 [Thermodesulfobacteriota bacterium]|nr:nitrogenase component 1 [Thermodesulfobacteriota bacterium]
MTKMPNYISTTNACKLCKPLGAALAFRGIEGAVSYLHGSQGCATYMRRYIISHYNEPVDIASSSLSEKHAVYGGGANLKLGLINVNKKYQPKMVGIATTCLTETIGDDVPMILKEFEQETAGSTGMALNVNVSTPSYSGTHMEGFHGAIASVVDQLGEDSPPNNTINLLPGFVSSADYRHLNEIVDDFKIEATILPDLSETLDGPALLEYEKVPQGGTPLQAIREMGGAGAGIEFGRTLGKSKTGGDILKARFGVANHRLGLPIGINETDRFFELLSDFSGREMSRQYELERGRLIDAYVDGHKYVFGKKAIVYGEEDMVVGLTSFLAEIGVQPVLCASGGKSGLFAEAIAAVTEGILTEQPRVYEGMDFFDIAEEAEELAPDLLVGHSKGYPLARKLDIPLIRVGFPVHDRVGGQRIIHLGYRGAQMLFDRVTNSLIEKKQNDSDVGYSYM